MNFKLYLILIFLFFIGCKNNSWIKSAEFKFEKEYNSYIKDKFRICGKRDLEFDKQRKIDALKRSSLNIIINNFFKQRSIKESVDSIYIINTHAPHFEIEGYRPYVFVLIFESNKFDTYYIELTKPYNMNYNESPYPLKELLQSSSGCGYGYRIITKITEKNNWEIVLFQINPDQEVLKEGQLKNP